MRLRSLIILWYVLIVISRISLRSPKYAPIRYWEMPYFISLSIFCSTRIMRGTKKSILKELLLMALLYYEEIKYYCLLDVLLLQPTLFLHIQMLFLFYPCQYCILSTLCSHLIPRRQPLQADPL